MSMELVNISADLALALILVSVRMESRVATQPSASIIFLWILPCQVPLCCNLKTVRANIVLSNSAMAKLLTHSPRG